MWQWIVMFVIIENKAKLQENKMNYFSDPNFFEPVTLILQLLSVWKKNTKFWSEMKIYEGNEPKMSIFSSFLKFILLEPKSIFTLYSGVFGNVTVCIKRKSSSICQCYYSTQIMKKKNYIQHDKLCAEVFSLG